jgi:hypothetical protein
MQERSHKKSWKTNFEFQIKCIIEQETFPINVGGIPCNANANANAVKISSSQCQCLQIVPFAMSMASNLHFAMPMRQNILFAMPVPPKCPLRNANCRQNVLFAMPDIAWYKKSRKFPYLLVPGGNLPIFLKKLMD